MGPHQVAIRLDARHRRRAHTHRRAPLIAHTSSLLCPQLYSPTRNFRKHVVFRWNHDVPLGADERQVWPVFSLSGHFIGRSTAISTISARLNPARVAHLACNPEVRRFAPPTTSCPFPALSPFSCPQNGLFREAEAPCWALAKGHMPQNGEFSVMGCRGSGPGGDQDGVPRSNGVRTGSGLVGIGFNRRARARRRAALSSAGNS